MKREYFDLFIGVGRGELCPYASYYLTGFLNERPLARVRQDLKHLGIERAEGQREPEDHLAILCEMMAGFAAGRFEAEAGERARLLRAPPRALGRPLLRRSGEGGVRAILPRRSGRSAGCSWRSRRKAFAMGRAERVGSDRRSGRRAGRTRRSMGGREMQDKQPTAMDRRNFLRAFGGVSTAAVAAVASLDRRARRRPTTPARTRPRPATGRPITSRPSTGRTATRR